MWMKMTARTLCTWSIAGALALAAGACGDNNNNKGPADAGVDAIGTPDASCFENPTTNEQIINACTDADKVYKTPVLPLLNPDGTLPSLPP